MNPRLRSQVLSEWTGISSSFKETPQPSDLRDVFQKAFTKLGLGSRLRESNLTEAWLELVGPTLAAHCRPKTVRRGVLFIAVDHPAWLHQITLAHKADILGAVQKHFPHLKITDLNLRIGH